MAWAEAQAQALLEAVLITPAAPYDPSHAARTPGRAPFKASELYCLVQVRGGWGKGEGDRWHCRGSSERDSATRRAHGGQPTATPRDIRQAVTFEHVIEP